MLHHTLTDHFFLICYCSCPEPFFDFNILCNVTYVVLKLSNVPADIQTFEFWNMFAPSCQNTVLFVRTFQEPGVWSDWSAWGTCSVTCDGGMRVRTRECVTESGEASTRARCEDGMANETMTCHDFPCYPGTVTS